MDADLLTDILKPSEAPWLDSYFEIGREAWEKAGFVADVHRVRRVIKKPGNVFLVCADTGIPVRLVRG